jgi:hypothetical protein
MNSYRIIRRGYNKDYGYIFAQNLDIALLRARILYSWVKRENLKQIKNK